jgi:VCBS repeat-containing protein
VSIDDGHGGVASQTVTITITGSNDAAVITGDTGGTVAEDSGTPSTVSGDLDHTDVDDNNANDVWQSTSGSSTYGSWTIDAAGVWTYTLNDALPAVDALQDGETLPDSFTVYTEDGSAKTVTITITGTNDAPVIAPIAQNNLDEQTDTSDLTANIVVNFTDAELLDTGHTATVTGVTWSGDVNGLTEAQLKALVTPGVVNKPVGSSNGSVTLAFVAASTVFDHLAENEPLELTYTVEIDDGEGGTDTETFVVKITGTNDAPTIENLVGTFDEDDLDDLVGGINLLDLGNAEDVDGDTISIVADGLDLGSVPDGIDADLTIDFGGFDFTLSVEALIQSGLMSLDPDGTLTMHPSLADALKLMLDDGDTVTVNGSLTITDGIVDDVQAAINVVLEGSGSAIPEFHPDYGVGNEPDFLVPTFDHEGAPST